MLSCSPAQELAALRNSTPLELQASFLDKLDATSGPIEIGIHLIDFFPLILTVSPDIYSSIEFDPDNLDPTFDCDNPSVTSKVFTKSNNYENDDNGN